MSMYFALNPGNIEVVPWYANNEICLQEVRFSVPASKWNEFLKSDLFQELEKYVDNLEIQDMNTYNREKQYTEEIERRLQNSIGQEDRGSFWARVRTWIRHKRRI